ncbi:MAG: hypothetical protein ACJ8C4_13910 [Gemmataceae bacterium]
MASHGLNKQEVETVVRVCQHFRLGEYLPDALKNFIAARLRDESPSLALRVEQMNRSQFLSLLEEVKSLQAASGGGAAAPYVVDV